MRKLAPVLFLSLALVGCATGDSEQAASALDLEDDAQRASYAQGVRIGQQGQHMPVEVDAFLSGIRDGLAGEGQLDDAAMEEALMAFQQLIAAAAEEEAAANLAEGEAWLAENAERPEVSVTASGLQYEVIEEGDGPRPGPADTVRVHYVGTLTDGTQFDSSYDGAGEPVQFSLGRVIPGWSEGVQLMPVGATYKLYLPGPLAYGERPQPGGVIRPNDTLVFEVTLLEIVGQ